MNILSAIFVLRIYLIIDFIFIFALVCQSLIDIVITITI